MNSERNDNTSYTGEGKSWYRLDNIAMMHGFSHSVRNTCIFRISCFLSERIHLSTLQKALDLTMMRFPYYRVQMKPGFFQYYWKKQKSLPQVMKDSRYPCEYMPLHRKKMFPIRIRAFYNSISCEFHHSITDGGGGLNFIRSLISEYFQQKSIDISRDEKIHFFGDPIDVEEYEDSFHRHYIRKVPQPSSLINALRLPFDLLPKKEYHITTGIVPVKAIIAKAKSYNCTVTEYLASIYIFSLQVLFDKEEKKKGPIRIIIPVNLRNVLESVTQRNFFLWARPGIDTRLGHYSFDDILKIVKNQMALYLDKKELLRQVKVNVGWQLNLPLRLLPLILKRLLIKIIYSSLGEKQQSGVLTNLGQVRMPSSLSKEVEAFEFIPAPSPITKVSCGVISYGDRMHICFGSLVRKKEVERLFFSFLRKEGITAKIQSNHMEESHALLRKVRC